MLLILAVQTVADRFLSSSLFLVEEVEIAWPNGFAGQSERFRLNPPTSIFRIDLPSLSRAFQQRYPSVEVQEIRRFLPDRLVAHMRYRNVVAQIQQASRYFPVADDGTLVGKGQQAPIQGLPILALGPRRGRLQPGGSIADSDFWKASALLSTLQRGGGLAGCRVKQVQVEGPDLLLHLDSGLEIRFASDRLASGWQRLGELMVSKRDVLSTAAYLDLRFEDPVIREKGKKKVRR